MTPFRSQLNLFIKQDGRLMTPFHSATCDDDDVEMTIFSLIMVVTQHWKKYFDAAYFQDVIQTTLSKAWKQGKAVSCQSGLEFVAIKSAMGVEPVTLVDKHNLGEYTPPDLILSGAGRETLSQLFWTGPQPSSALTSNAGAVELLKFKLCMAASVNPVPMDRPHAKLVLLTEAGYKYAIEHMVHRSGKTPPLGLVL